ncbi:hypothetical protein [Limnoglobus roseus]|uniref:Uncharacterized protein n=1 Tax=Limnoglobus roseus TaxID=2598579 RepID=A0A5C1A5Q5_9BACT|nr:hypothetical protein [Limnoglobus roseus]QEL13162.1 hypothetical protein PX52LOC_00015 [Limnoglobus roseus]
MKRFFFGLVAVAALTGTLAAQTDVKPKHLYGHDLKVRPVGEQNFKAETPKVGIEVFHDTVGNALLAVSDSGNIAAVPFTAVGDKKAADWAFAHELRVRKSTEEAFTKDTKKYAIEAYKDLGSGNLLYVTDQKTIAFGPLPKDLKTEAEPAFHHGLTLKVRGLSEDDFSKAKKFGVDVSKDGNTGGLIYVTEAGSIATAAAPAAPPGESVKAPKALHGMKLQARKADEGDFTAQTRAYAVEAYSDPNSGAVVYFCETGAIATAPQPAQVTKGPPRWHHSFLLKARKPGEKDFEKAAKFGVEAFVDQNTGHTVYISETGSIAVVPGK